MIENSVIDRINHVTLVLVENAGGDMAECSSPGSPNQSSSASPLREVRW